MKIINEITVTLSVNYSNQPRTVKSSLGFVPFFVLERKGTENQKYKHASFPHVSILTEPFAKHPPEWQIPLTLSVLGLQSVPCR